MSVGFPSTAKRPFICLALLAWAVLLIPVQATHAQTLNATFNAPTDVPVTANGYTASGTVNFTVNCALPTGTNLTVVNNTSLSFINGTFSNLAQGQAVTLSFGGVNYSFVANYYGGTGNDLVLVWANNRPVAWGWDIHGELGNNAVTAFPTAVPVSTSGALAGKTVTMVAAGEYHTVALCSDGTVVAWGFNDNGQLGNGTTTQSNVPVAVNALGVLAGKRVIAVAAGYDHSLALCSDGSVAAWGGNGRGQLGNGSMTQSTVPVAVSTRGTALAGKTVTALAAGSCFSLALCSDGKLVSWGGNGNGQLGNNRTVNSSVAVEVSTSGTLAGKTVTTVAAGQYHGLALCSDGTAATWGCNNFGQLGDGSTSSTSAPVAVNASAGSALSGKKIIAAAAGAYHCLALCSDGTVTAWGFNRDGQLGNKSRRNSSVPVVVNTHGTALTGRTVVRVSAGFSHSLALCSDGTMASWGFNFCGQLGNDSTIDKSEPVVASTGGTALAGKTVTTVAGGYYYSLALCSDGTVAAWGDNSRGQLGNNGPSGFPAPVDVSRVLAGKTVIAQAAGYTHSLVLCSDGTVAAWGSNDHGQLGNDGTMQSDVPVLVSTSGVLAGKTVIAVAAGSDHSLALCSDGTVASWGNTGTIRSAMAVGTSGTALEGRTVVAVAAGSYHNLALCSDGTVAAWGNNSNGQLGNNSTTHSATPVAVSTSGTALAGKTVVAIAAGFMHSLALCSDGTVAAWGCNSSGQLGNNSTSNSTVPVAVSTHGSALAGKIVIGVAAGYRHSLALCSDGVVAAWGANESGQLGNNSTSNSMVPVAVSIHGSALTGKVVTAVGAGYCHSMALCSDGMVAAWGGNSRGQLGNNSMNQSTVPMAVSMTSFAEGERFSLARSGQNAYHNIGLIAEPPYAVVTARDGITMQTHSVVAPRLTNLNTWRQTYFPGSTSTTGPGADMAMPFNDSVGNLIKFALGMDPTKQGKMPGILSQSGGNLFLTYTPSAQAVADGVTFVVEYSDTLAEGTWATDIVNQGSIGAGGSPVTATVPKGYSGHRFLRLKITSP